VRFRGPRPHRAPPSTRLPVRAGIVRGRLCGRWPEPGISLPRVAVHPFGRFCVPASRVKAGRTVSGSAIAARFRTGH